MSVAFFDLDKTILAKSSALAFGTPFSRAGLLSRRAMLRSAYVQFMFSLQAADHETMERLRDYLSEMVTGWQVEEVSRVVQETLNELIVPMVYDEAAALIEEHKAAGRKVVIVSSSGADIVGPIAHMLGVDDYLATKLTVVDGKYTGEISFYCYAENKAVAMRDYADKHGIDLAECYAYSDSMTDLPMLAAVGHPFAVNPDKGLRKEAVERNWPVLEFRRPVSIYDRFSAVRIPPKSAAAAIAIGLAVILLRRRRRRKLLSENVA